MKVLVVVCEQLGINNFWLIDNGSQKACFPNKAILFPKRNTFSGAVIHDVIATSALANGRDKVKNSILLFSGCFSSYVALILPSSSISSIKLWTFLIEQDAIVYVFSYSTCLPSIQSYLSKA